MTVLLYLPEQPNRHNGRLKDVLLDAISPAELEIVTDPPTLERRLRHLMASPSVVVLAAPTETDLRELLKRRELLSGLRSILILADSDPGALAQGRLLNPRYIGSLTGDMTDLAAVLRNMTGRPADKTPGKEIMNQTETGATALVDREKPARGRQERSRGHRE
ncbi:MAG: hypothetical protein AB1641_00435 [Thermodesulfobacteriota bacterium]